MTAPFDPGLQAERTLLAWRRTSLAFALASAASVRFTIESLGVTGVTLGLVGIGLAAGCYQGAARRYRSAHETLTAHRLLRSGGMLLALATAAAVVLGTTAMLFIIN